MTIRLLAPLIGAVIALHPGVGAADAVLVAAALPTAPPTDRGEATPPADPALPLQAAGPARPQLPGDAAAPGAGPEFGPLGLPCTADLEARPGPGGTVALRLEAPCHASAPVSLQHGALRATYLTSSSGVIETIFPAFAARADYSARLPGGQVLTAAALVPGAEGYERVATFWTGASGLAVHAFEYGAAQGGAGHVWRGAPRAATVAEAGRGGFLLSLGTASPDPGFHHAEVYSFPAAAAARAGAVRIALGAEITAETCGRTLSAATLQIGHDLPGAPVTLSLELPGCDRAGGYLMLKNLARDLKIAAN